MSLFGTGRREGVFAVLVLLLLSALLHSPTLLAGFERAADDRTAATAHLQASTNRSVLVPAMQAAAAQVEAGHLPRWNDLGRLGEPFTTSGAALWYPPFWLLLLSPTEGWLGVLSLLHTFMACMFMYRFMRVLSLSRYVAFLGGGMYGLGWFFNAGLDRLPEAAAAALLPLALELTWRIVVTSERRRYAPLLGFALGAMFWTGGQATATLGLGLVIGMAIAEGIVLDADDRAKTLRAATGAAALALLLTAPIWLDVLQTAPATAADTSARPAALQTAGLWSILAPNLFGDLSGRSGEVLQAINPGADPLELALFPGAFAFFLLVLGLLRPKHTYLGVFWLLVIGAGLLLTLDGPVAAMLAGVLPSRLLEPGSALVLFHLGVVVWIGLAFENFLDAPQRRGFATPLTAIVCLVAVAGLALSVYTPHVLGVLRSLSGISFAPDLELARGGVARALLPTLITLASISVLFLVWRRLGVLRFKPLLACAVLAELIFHGLCTAPYRSETQPLVSLTEQVPVSDGRVAAVGRSHLPVESLMSDGRATLSTSGDALLRRTARYLSLVDPAVVRVGSRSKVARFRRPAQVADPLLRKARVDTLIAGEPTSVPGFVPLASAPAGETEAPGTIHTGPRRGPVFVARRDVPPPWELTYSVVSAASEEAAAGLLRDPVIVQNDSTVVEGADPTFRCHIPAAAAELDVVQHRPDRLTLNVDMREGRGYLIWRDAWAPGWRATVDGTPVPVLPADLAFRAIAVPEGSHRIDLRYAPWSARFGLPLLFAGLVLTLGLSLYGFLRRR